MKKYEGKDEILSTDLGSQYLNLYFKDNFGSTDPEEVNLTLYDMRKWKFDQYYIDNLNPDTLIEATDIVRGRYVITIQILGNGGDGIFHIFHMADWDHIMAYFGQRDSRLDIESQTRNIQTLLEGKEVYV